MMHAGFTQYVDVAQVALYAFWVFFFGLVVYLHREDKREGYPLVSEVHGHTTEEVSSGFPPTPAPKRFRLFHGGEAFAPGTGVPRLPVGAVPAAAFPGAPLEPTGHPLVDGIGPASWCYRVDEPDLTIDGKLKIVPMREAGEYSLHPRSMDPRGYVVVGRDGLEAGVVADLWLDEIEEAVRYLEVRLTLPGFEGERVLVPAGFATFRRRLRRMAVRSVWAHLLADVPRLADPGQVTRQEEDRLVGFFGGGALFAERLRRPGAAA